MEDKADREKFQEVIADMKESLVTWNRRGVLMNIQFKIKDSGMGCSISSMTAADSFGALEFAKAIVASGLNAHQHFDSMVQAMEARPDLVDRFTKLLHSAHEEKSK